MSRFWAALHKNYRPPLRIVSEHIEVNACAARFDYAAAVWQVLTVRPEPTWWQRLATNVTGWRVRCGERWQRFPDYSVGGLDVWVGDDQEAPDVTAWMQGM